MSPFGIRRPNGGAKAVVYALLVHVFVIGLLVISVRWNSQTPRPASNVIKATVVADAEVKKEIEQLKRQSEKLQEIEAQRQKEAQQQAAAETKKRAELEKQNAADLKRKTAEKKKLEEKKAAEVAKQRAAAEQQKKEMEQRRKQAESGLQEQLAEEEKERARVQAAAQAARQQGEVARYEAIIRQKVERSWTRPANSRDGLECIVQVRLVPGGEVLQAAVVRTSGNPIFDRAALNAVYKASPLPVPDDKSMFEHFREFEFKFRPEG